MRIPKRKIKVCGYEVEIWDCGYAKYFYPSFNGDAEYKVSKQGFKDLCSYLRGVSRITNMM